MRTEFYYPFFSQNTFNDVEYVTFESVSLVSRQNFENKNWLVGSNMQSNRLLISCADPGMLVISGKWLYV